MFCIGALLSIYSTPLFKIHSTAMIKKVRRKVKFRRKLKLWRLRESEVKEEFAEGVNNICHGNEDWCGLKSCWMLRVKSVVILKANPGILKRGDGINMWMWLWVER